MRAWVRLWALSAPGWGVVSGWLLELGSGRGGGVARGGEGIPEANCTKASLKGFLSRPAMMVGFLPMSWSDGISVVLGVLVKYLRDRVRRGSGVRHRRVVPVRRYRCKHCYHDQTIDLFLQVKHCDD